MPCDSVMQSSLSTTWIQQLPSTATSWDLPSDSPVRSEAGSIAGKTKPSGPCHPASQENPAGTVQLGFAVSDVDGFFGQGQQDGLSFTSEQIDVHGTRIARFLDCDGAEVSVSSSGQCCGAATNLLKY
jgi:predicted enzyme related to lactoylglutathione lyase